MEKKNIEKQNYRVEKDNTIKQLKKTHEMEQPNKKK